MATVCDISTAGLILPNVQLADVTVSGLTQTGTAGEDLVFADPCYLKSDGKWWKADANGSSTYPCVMMAAATIAANASGVFLRNGVARNDAWNWTVGGTLYLSDSATITQTAPSTSGDIVQVLGIAGPNADTIQWQPSLDYLTVA